MLTKRIHRDFFSRDTATVARCLVGKLLVTEKGSRCSAVIVETEAYYGQDDPASHAYRGPTPRNSLMFGRAGIAYVYLCYGVYYLFNVVTEKEGSPGAVLIRGAVPVEGIELMEKRINQKNSGGLCSGPGKLTLAMGISLADNRKDIAAKDSDIYITSFRYSKPVRVESSTRIGIKKGSDKLLRFYTESQPGSSF